MAPVCHSSLLFHKLPTIIRPATKQGCGAGGCCATCRAAARPLRGSPVVRRPRRCLPSLLNKGSPTPKLCQRFQLHGGCLFFLLRLSLRWDSKHGPSYIFFSWHGVSLPFSRSCSLYQQLVAFHARERELSVCSTQLRSDRTRPTGAGDGVGAGVGIRLRSSFHSQFFALFQFPSWLSGRVERDDRRICHSLGNSPPEQPSA